MHEGARKKEWVLHGGVFPGRPRAFGINADQWTPAAQSERECRRMAGQGAESFMAKWIAAEKARAGLRHAVQRTVVCPNVTGRTNEMIAQRKRVRAGSLAIIDEPQVTLTRIFQADAVLSFSGVTFFFCFFFVTTVVCVLFRFCFFLFLFIWRRRFFRAFFAGLSSGVSRRYSYCGKTTVIISVQAFTVIKHNYRYRATRYREKTHFLPIPCKKRYRGIHNFPLP